MNKYCKNCYELAEKLKQKERECNTLKGQLDFAVRQKERFEQQCEALKSEAFTRESLITLQENEIDELRQECEELLKENQQLRNSLSDSLMFKFTGQENETNRYRKALEEIEEATKYLKKDLCGHCGWYGTDGCTPSGMVCEELIKILDIINKAKGEGNE